MCVCLCVKICYPRTKNTRIPDWTTSPQVIDPDPTGHERQNINPKICRFYFFTSWLQILKSSY